MAQRTLRSSAAAALACASLAVSLAATSAIAVAPDAAVLGGHYRVVSTQGGQAGVIIMARTKQQMVAGSAISIEFHCRYSGNVIDEIDLVGVRVAPNGHFSRRDVTTDYGGDVESIKHIDGVFLTPRYARGTLWGVSAGPGVHTCHIAAKQPIRFRATYVSQTYP
jgi:hypothetical protein